MSAPGTGSPGDVAEEALLVALRWSLLNSAVTNSSLADLSNVSRPWRCACAGAAAEAARGEDGAAGSDGADGGPGLGGLLVVDMVRETLRAGGGGGGGLGAVGSFCLAWFGPEGIKATRLDGGPGGEDGVEVVEEWRGRRHPHEVLGPFGYAEGFVRSVFESALGERGAPPTERVRASHDHVPTPAVRGATLARPEGYCLCRDPDYVRRVLAEEASEPPSCPRRRRRPSRSDLLARMGRDRRGIAGALLPRKVLSTARKYPLLHRAADGEADGGGRADPPALPFERRVPSVQFLNADLSQALRMITPPFACGPAPGPVTVFLVAATTEDGCFVSGRRVRHEVGHMYPLSGRDMLNDMSPVCIATGRPGEAGGPPRRRVGGGGGGDDSDDDSDDSDDRSVHCVCEFDSGDPFAVPGEDGEASRDEEDPSEDRIRRGTTGPGLWHCYTAVFDGDRSVVRVDGAEEPRTTRVTAGLPDGSGPDSLEEAGTRVGDVPLDGLTIGSDHLFNESLCYGMIEGECGEGSISELAVFRGRLGPSDLERVESHLMGRHGILTAAGRSDILRRSAGDSLAGGTDCGLREDDWTRQANALIVQRRPWRLVSDPRVPLRVAANHPSVSWRRRSGITGDEVRVARIGARSSNGSSDW